MLEGLLQVLAVPFPNQVPANAYGEGQCLPTHRGDPKRPQSLLHLANPGCWGIGDRSQQVKIFLYSLPLRLPLPVPGLLSNKYFASMESPASTDAFPLPSLLPGLSPAGDQGSTRTGELS